MKANPGGYIPPHEVIGRDVLISCLWDVLQRQSLILTAERRIGKTRVIDKMRMEAAVDKLPYFRDLEHVHTALEFAEMVFRDVEDALSRSNRPATRVRSFLAQLNGAEFQGAKFPSVAAAHWKDLLSKTIEDLMENQEKMVIFFWDELPWMIDNIKVNDGDRVAMEVLDTLRFLRQTHPRLRMVFTGSIGLHHVIAALKEKGYANSPINDMYSLDVPVLAPHDAQELARLLLEGEGIQTHDRQAAAHAIAAAVDNNAFYIHHMVDRLKVGGHLPNEAAIEEIISEALFAGQDHWDLRHYRVRIDTYYKDDASLVLQLLDILALAEEPLSLDDLFNRLQSQTTSAEAEKTRDTLTLLQRDHYVDRVADGAYCFRIPLIRRWWRLNRGLRP